MEQENMSVPYIVYEGAQARQERTIKRLIVVIIIIVTMLFASNAIWLYFWNQYDYAMEYEQIDLDSGNGGNANYIGRDLNGELNNGENKNNESESYEDAQDW